MHQITALGGVIANVTRRRKVVCYLSWSLSTSERKFSETEKECLAVLLAIKRRCSDKFMLNQQVWRHNYVISDAREGITSKLSPKFKGTLKIIRICSPSSYELADVQRKSCGIWHAENLESHPPEVEIDLGE
ncbi:hypothetical protein JTB14_010832 [Gonioctena quinquepunctata]|nr:hypothetical protein JTB14_010832 [Gonioctena quinquepunctata]